MQNHWKTKQKDLATARKIIFSHIEDTKVASIADIRLQLDGPVNIKRADWAIALEEMFEQEYGDQGRDVYYKVMTSLLTGGAQVH